MAITENALINMRVHLSFYTKVFLPFFLTTHLPFIDHFPCILCKTFTLLTKAPGQVNHQVGWGVCRNCQPEEPWGTGNTKGDA